MEGCNVFWLLHLGKLRRMLIWNLESVDISIMTVITKNSQPNLNLCSICCSSWLQVYWAWWHSSQSTYRVGWCHCKTFLNYFWINKQKKKQKTHLNISGYVKRSPLTGSWQILFQILRRVRKKTLACQSHFRA